MPDAAPSPPRSTPWVFRAFARYNRRYLGKHFHRFQLANEHSPPPNPDGLPVVIYLNHPAWWDPLVCVELARRFYPQRGQAAPIDAEALKQYGFFKRLGFFGVEPDSPRGGSQFLRNALRVCQQDDAALWITAEGHFTDPRQRPVQLMPGLSHLAHRLPRGLIIPLAIEIAYWDQRTPELLARFGEPIDAGTPLDSPEAWQDELTQRLTRSLECLAADSIARNTEAFTPLVGGKTGVGGVYDFWRRTKAALTGQRFDPQHRGSESRPQEPSA